jgi:quinoprotein glucose dehydrogenase
MSPFGLPCTPPPWGTLAAVDLKRNTIRWQVLLGSTRDKVPWLVPSATLGMPNLGGPVLTAGGIAFIAATMDNYLRAFDVETGRELWKGRLPAGGQATPMTYQVDGRQFVVIAAGGHGGLGTTRGDYVVAFALRSKE